VLIGPVEATMPDRKPMPAPTSAMCQALMRRPRASSHRRAGIMSRNMAPRMPSTRRGSRISRVRAPNAAAGMAVAQ